MSTEYLSEEQLAGFDKYKYSSKDTSPVSKYITHPFWNQCVKLVPLWVAPNVLTFASFLCLVFSLVLLSLYDTKLVASSRHYPDSPPIPNWVWVVAGVCQFLSHTLDGIDGKQARRTQTSGPLGELFDHGVDSWSTMFLSVALFSVFSRDTKDFGEGVFTMYWVLWCILICFIASHWEKYNTGVLFLPWGYDVVQIMMTIIYLLTGIFGVNVWKGTYFGWLEFRKVFLIALYVGSYGFTLPHTFYNVYRSYKDRSGKMHPFTEAMRPLFSTIFLFLVATMWVHGSTYDILEEEPRIVFWAIGTMFSNITCRLIVSQMSSTRAELFNGLLIPFMLVPAISLAVPIGIYELYLTWALAIFLTIAHLHYGVCVVRQMCDHFNINCFTITKRPPKKKEITPQSASNIEMDIA
ncbi:ethanolaminephosphotransferase 1-like [Saccoglossus kowalevskii]|uniref:Ethanolaminephosphotransferase 1-like n=1 Tax=Saccoglossus kowalevskii TaxID=10224 RepID=A0ABM0MH58_SACKO|nr:PREDICTED: ethanolaminephosphotransferase 1-like [Saccoglossus kowalevskii]